MPAFAFRVDASAAIGSGHFVRCLALAQTLRARGCKVSFVSRNLPQPLKQEALGSGIDVLDLPPAEAAPASNIGHAVCPDVRWGSDAKQTLAVLGRLDSVDWMVVDHYGLDRRWESLLRQGCRQILVIDDLADRGHDCEILVNQNLVNGGQQRYSRHVPPGTRLLLGPQFALLREQFVHARNGLSRNVVRATKVLLALGGSDPQGVTLRVLKAMERLLATEVRLTVVVGVLNIHREEIRRGFGRSASITLVEHVGEMAALMVDADLAIGAGGTSLWERCCVGLPSLVLTLAENQVEVARMAAERGACLYIGDATRVTQAQILDGLQTLMNDGQLRKSMSDAALGLVDGLGCSRVVDALLGARLLIRAARPEDAHTVFPWRNSGPVRRASHDPRPLILGNHLAWFQRTLADPNRLLLIGEDLQGPLGVLRYDLQGEEATVSIYLDPERQGRGYSTALLREGERWLRERRPEIALLRAEVLADNDISRRTFSAAGFTQHGAVFEKPLGPVERVGGSEPDKMGKAGNELER